MRLELHIKAHIVLIFNQISVIRARFIRILQIREPQMFTTDVFLFVESFLGAAIGFINSVLFSIALLIDKPKIAPRFLQKRFKDPSTKQVGPLTLIFLAVLLGFLPNLILTRKNLADQIPGMFNEDGKTSLAIIVASCLIGTVFIDGLARTAVLLGWPHHLHIAGRYYRRESQLNRRLRASYFLVIPTFIGSIVLICLVILMINGVITLNPFSSDFFYNLIACLCIICFANAVVIKMSYPHFFHYVLPRSIKNMRVAIEWIVFFIVVPTMSCMVYVATIWSYYFINDIYPRTSAKSEIADLKDIVDIDAYCIIRNNQIEFGVAIFNRSKGPALLSKNGIITIKWGNSENTIEDEESYEFGMSKDNYPVRSDILSPNSILWREEKVSFSEEREIGEAMCKMSIPYAKSGKWVSGWEIARFPPDQK